MGSSLVSAPCCYSSTLWVRIHPSKIYLLELRVISENWPTHFLLTGSSEEDTVWYTVNTICTFVNGGLHYTVKKVIDFRPDYQTLPGREQSFDIPAGEGKIYNLFMKCIITDVSSVTSSHCEHKNRHSIRSKSYRIRKKTVTSTVFEIRQQMILSPRRKTPK